MEAILVPTTTFLDMHKFQKKIWSLEMSSEVFHTSSPAISWCTWMGGGVSVGHGRGNCHPHHQAKQGGWDFSISMSTIPQEKLWTVCTMCLMTKRQGASSDPTFEKGHQVSLSPVQTDCPVCQDSRKRGLPPSLFIENKLPSGVCCMEVQLKRHTVGGWVSGSIQKLPPGAVQRTPAQDNVTLITNTVV